MRLIVLALCLVCFYGQASEKNKVSTVLDSLHRYASEAKFDSYFNLYSDEAIFIGTDASETWTLEEFKNYTKPVFDRGSGWTYKSRDRHIYFSPNKDVAWFDELLDNASLGLTRGTGVLVKTDAGWKVTQYHLTIPIPNDIADSVAEQIKAYNGMH
ncbi:MAG: nuclear transport factor 2 family protein [Gammaproteobacteria bacterium]|nr:nuclear transport factor 2 family protein [Gammaproteobacteria bacterium]